MKAAIAILVMAMLFIHAEAEWELYTPVIRGKFDTNHQRIQVDADDTVSLEIHWDSAPAISLGVASSTWTFVSSTTSPWTPSKTYATAGTYDFYLFANVADSANVPMMIPHYYKFFRNGVH